MHLEFDQMKDFGGKIERVEGRPAHMLVRERILGLIDSGVLPSGSQLPAEPVLAHLFGVSRMTANRAINDLRLAGYLTRQKGRGTFVHDTTKVTDRTQIAVVLSVDIDPAFDDSYFGPLFWGLFNFANRGEYHLQFVRMGPELALNPDIARSAGVIVIAPELDSMPALHAIQKSGTPIVVLGASWDQQAIECIDSDNKLGASLAVNHLADLGNNEISFVGGYPDSSNTQDRLNGFKFAMKARGLSTVPEKHVFMAQTTSLSESQLIEIGLGIKSGRLPRAIFAAGPMIAFQLHNHLKMNGLRIPEDVSVVGYDDPSYLMMLQPTLTTIRQPLTAMAEFAMERLLSIVTGTRANPGTTLFDPTLILRDSSRLVKS